MTRSGETSLRHRNALVVDSLRGTEVLAELRVSALGSTRKLGLARLEGGVGIRNARLEARVDCGSAIVEILNALLQGHVLFAELALDELSHG